MLASKRDKAELRKATRDYAFDLFRDYKRGEAFSNVDPRKFFDIMGIDISALLSHEKIIDKLYISKDRSRLLALNLTETYEAEGHPSTGNEAKKSDFVKPFITSVIYFHNKKYTNNKLRLERELLIDHDVAAGNVEYVVVDKCLALLIIEVKKDNWDLGRAQNMLEMFVAHQQNVDNGANNLHIVYGCVSTGSEWEIYSYGGTNAEWHYYGRKTPLQIVDPEAEIVFNTEDIDNMCAVLNGIITASLGTLHIDSTFHISV